ncbi:MAG: type IV pilin N-terminal domain-containing protein [Methanoregula sp.]|jgi:FlaG/FlaF family flagellin (archaellin)
MSSTKQRKDPAVSPVIGVMLMIVVTIIIAAVVAAFAGDYANSDKRAPTAVISAEVLPWVEVPYGNSTGILFTEESGDFINLNDVQVVLSCGAESVRFAASDTRDTTPYGTPHLWKVNATQSNTNIFRGDSQINTGNQFMLSADNNGNGQGVLGWTTPSVFYLKNTTICTYQIIDAPSQQTISGGKIDL